MRGGWPMRFLATLGARGGVRGRLSILIYHRVLAERDPINPTELDRATFWWQMELARRFFNVLPLGEAVRMLIDNRLPARSLCVTFDDGYADNAEIALPVLRELGLPATFFIATSFLDGGRMWNDTVIEAIRRLPRGPLDLRHRKAGAYELDGSASRAEAVGAILRSIKHRPPAERQEITDQLAAMCYDELPRNLMMATGQVRKLRDAGMEIGAHTVTHPILARLPAREARREIEESREFLEGLLNERVSLFAYPNGKPGQDYRPEHVEMVRRMGFVAAVSTAWGVSTPSSDRWQLARFTPWDRTPLRFVLRLLQNCLRCP